SRIARHQQIDERAVVAGAGAHLVKGIEEVRLRNAGNSRKDVNLINIVSTEQVHCVLGNVISFDDVLSNFPLEAQRPLMYLRILRIRIDHTDRTGSESRRLAQYVWCGSRRQTSDYRRNVAIQTTALTKRGVRYCGVVARRALKNRRAKQERGYAIGRHS